MKINTNYDLVTTTQQKIKMLYTIYYNVGYYQIKSNIVHFTEVLLKLLRNLITHTVNVPNENIRVTQI